MSKRGNYLKKGQQSTEILFIIGTIFIIVFLTYLFMISPWNNQSNEMRFYLNAKTMTEELCGRINQVSYMGNGYGVQLTLPAMLGAEVSYETTVYNGSVETVWNFGPSSQNRSFECIIKVGSIKFLGQEPAFVLNKTDLEIKNKDGAVVIE